MSKKKIEKPSAQLQMHSQIEHSIKLKPRKFKFTDKQRKFLETALDPQNSIIFVAGPAGSAKSYSSIYVALQL